MLEIFKRFMPLNGKDNVYMNGSNNLYPCEIQGVISNSPTAKRAAIMMAKYSAGTLIGEDVVVNRRKGLRISGLARLIADDLAVQGGAFVLVKYRIRGGEVVPDELDVLDYTKCRISKEDDEDNSGNIIYKDFEDKKSRNKKALKFFPWTPDKNVLLAQIKSAGDSLESAVRNFKGNVMFINPTNYLYPLSPFDAVYNEMDSEYRISLYTNAMTRTGFLGKTAVLINGLDDDEAKQAQEDVTKWLGSENSSGVYFMDVDTTQDLDNVLKVLTIPGQYDDKMFEATQKRIRENIMGAANNIPLPLVLSSQGALFGSSGEAYAEMKEFYSEQTAGERELLQNILNALGYPVELAPLGGIQQESDGQDVVSVSPETLAAQAALRGSVGGVQGVLGIQQSVSEGLTDVRSAITILMEIYGFTREVSQQLLGQPIEEPQS